MDGPNPTAAPAASDPRRTELLLEALKTAIHTPGEHRLFQSGKLPGLFPSRAGLSNETALLALREGLLETVRTEAKGKLITEWVCATPKAVGFVHDHDSPRSILRELKDVLLTTRTGVPQFMADARAELAALSANFEEKAATMLARLDELAKRCEAALRRAEASGQVIAAPVGQLVPWALSALEYLDKRAESGVTPPCPLPELFHAVCVKFPQLVLAEFHDGVKRLHDVRAIKLIPTAAIPEPEYAVVVEGKLMYAVGR
ncbi:hypothetical protein GobsT_39490 [Gemmata obscuriglobus]|uniref:Uncharacterized protein n=1 Tax=Gemmata obscuriglobus TaxID=114 RepID=A0A2Z3GU87_9BACT|nr:hypothetical protein [Gemmata obscuriglobus]AWM37979.1 hypothetical protein C1280_13915 [Gemmata obscuriglobus]QEG29160.1 hypothetical protein GobsT_39490 [Gemmata obscuriglobus]VTS07895.1 unnamed protein product [Gemmata obscuriglobus UQM 2246]